jgi:hypothetical protein
VAKTAYSPSICGAWLLAQNQFFGPRLLGRRADLEETEQRIDSHKIVPDSRDYLKRQKRCFAQISYLFTLV